MTKTTLKTIFATILGATALSSTLNAEPARAFSITYDFTVDITSGTYSGKSYTGSFKYDNANLTGSGLEFVSPTVGNLGIQFSFLNKSYTQQQDRDASLDFPRAYFQDGTLLGLSFLVVPPTSSPGFFIVPKMFRIWHLASMWAIQTLSTERWSGLFPIKLALVLGRAVVAPVNLYQNPLKLQGLCWRLGLWAWA